MLEITTDPKRIDFDYVYRYISNSYWAKGRSTETLKTCIENSLNFSLYLNRRQIGYARIVTDYAVFAYLMDVFIDEEHRKKGYATNLLHYILHFDKLKTIEVWRLATTDAQELYKKFGFGLLENPDTMMELKKILIKNLCKLRKLFFITIGIVILTLGFYNYRSKGEIKSTSSKTENKKESHTLQEIARDGDIIFQTSTSNQSLAIQLATHSPYSHVGVIHKTKKGLFVFEAVNPVKMTKLDEWVKSGKNGKYVLKRLKDSETILTPETINKMKTEGEKQIGKKYDKYFGWSDEQMYCSELVWKLYKESTGIEICSTKKLSDFDLSHPLVIQTMKDRYKENIPMNETVISPKDIFDSYKLIVVLDSD